MVSLWSLCGLLRKLSLNTWLFPYFLVTAWPQPWWETLCFVLSIHSSVPLISRTPWGNHPQNWHKHSLGLKNELICFWWSKVKVAVTSHPSHSLAHGRSGTASGSYITSDSSVPLDSKDRVIKMFMLVCSSPFYYICSTGCSYQTIHPWFHQCTKYFPSSVVEFLDVL